MIAHDRTRHAMAPAVKAPVATRPWPRRPCVDRGRALRRGALAGLLAMTAAPVAHAQVYAVLDAHGRLQVASEPSPGALAFDPHRRLPPPKAAAPPATQAAGRAPLQPPAQWRALLQQVSREQGVELSLLHAVIQVESGYNPRARSPAGALGMMQVIPSTGKRFGATDLYDPLQNLRAGATYLAWLQQRFNGDLRLILAAYNAGEGAVQRHGQRVPPYSETQQYVQRVSALYHASRLSPP